MCIRDRPVPDAVFVGGSAGELPSVVEAALEKNSQVRLCVPCVTVETLTEACALLSGCLLYTSRCV